jgi:hypothetical protein
MAPFLIAIGAGTPLGGHLAPGLLPAFDDSLETPTYRPSNAVVGAAVCAAAVAPEAHTVSVNNNLAPPIMFASPPTRR